MDRSRLSDSAVACLVFSARHLHYPSFKTRPRPTVLMPAISSYRGRRVVGITSDLDELQGRGLGEYEAEAKGGTSARLSLNQEQILRRERE
jgi:hypothetical protein